MKENRRDDQPNTRGFRGVHPRHLLLQGSDGGNSKVK